MACGDPCQTIEVTARKTESQLQHFVGGTWRRVDAPAGGHEVNGVDADQHMAEIETEAVNAEKVRQQPFPEGATACDAECPCTGISKSQVHEPTFSGWKEFRSDDNPGPGGGQGTQYRVGIMIETTTVMIDGVCRRPLTPKPEDWKVAEKE